jgi:hypothetical protein
MYVSSLPEVVTQFKLGNNIAFLAHNGLAGKYFYEIKKGDIIKYDREYRVIEIERYREEGNLYISETTGEVYDVSQLFTLYYLERDTLVLQTCTLNGRLFIKAQ